MSLFSSPYKLPLDQADITYYPSFITQHNATRLFEHLLEITPWQQDDIKLFGKVHPQPRLTALYGNNGKSYSYSNITMAPAEFSSALSEIKRKIEAIAQVTFTTCLMNLYRDGRDSNGWHSDDEEELGTNPIIASLSLGEQRIFKFRKKGEHQLSHKMILENGSLLLMKGATQHYWQHQIPKTTREVGPRINLTFRIIL